MPERVMAMRAALASLIAAHMDEDGVRASEVGGLELYRRSAPTECTAAAYAPKLIIFVQGRKRIQVGVARHFSLGRSRWSLEGGLRLAAGDARSARGISKLPPTATHICDESTFLLTSVGLPVMSQVITATAKKPILGLILTLEMPRVREILGRQVPDPRAHSGAACGMAVGITTEDLLDACVRLVHLLDAPRDIPFLGPLIQGEIIYRVLRSPQGKHLRAIATLGEQSQRTARAVEWLRANYAQPLRVEELAAMARMGVSTLHHHFRSLMAMSPLQYQKRRRLQVARELMLHEGMDAASAAFAVGYESASQFSLEYSRYFGQPPMRDVKALRLSGAEAGTAAD